MSSIVRLATACAAVATAALLLVQPAKPAAADDSDVEVSLDCHPDPVTITQVASCETKLRNRTDAISTVGLTFLIHLPGLTHQQLAMDRAGGLPLLLSTTHPGEVKVVDPQPVELGSDGSRSDFAAIAYALRFLTGAPTGIAGIALTATSPDKKVLGSANEKLTVKAGVVATADTTSPPTATSTTASAPPAAPTPASSFSTVVAGPANQVRPAGGPPPGQASLWLYLVAGVLVSAGIVTLWALLRAPRAGMAGGSYRPMPYQPVRRPPAMPPPLPRRRGSGTPLAPTQQFPAVSTDPAADVPTQQLGETRTDHPGA